MNRKSKFTQSVTALYCRLSIEDGRDNESMSISNQDAICQGQFRRKKTNFHISPYGTTIQIAEHGKTMPRYLSYTKKLSRMA